MALVLIEELVALAGQAEARQDTELLIDCVTAAEAAFDASDANGAAPE